MYADAQPRPVLRSAELAIAPPRSPTPSPGLPHLLCYLGIITDRGLGLSRGIMTTRVGSERSVLRCSCYKRGAGFTASSCPTIYGPEVP